MSIKTKNKISLTLLALLDDNSYDELTISEIAAHSEIARKTFYNNFSTKEDVIRYIVEKLIDAYVSQIEKVGTKYTNIISLEYFRFAQNNKSIFKKLVNNNLFHYYMDKFDQLLHSLYYLTKSNEILDIDESKLDFVFTFNSYGVNQMICTWIKKGCIETIYDLDEIYHKITVF